MSSHINALCYFLTKKEKRLAVFFLCGSCVHMFTFRFISLLVILSTTASAIFPDTEARYTASTAALRLFAKLTQRASTDDFVSYHFDSFGIPPVDGNGSYNAVHKIMWYIHWRGLVKSWSSPGFSPIVNAGEKVRAGSSLGPDSAALIQAMRELLPSINLDHYNDASSYLTELHKSLWHHDYILKNHQSSGMYSSSPVQSKQDHVYGQAILPYPTDDASLDYFHGDDWRGRAPRRYLFLRRPIQDDVTISMNLALSLPQSSGEVHPSDLHVRLVGAILHQSINSALSDYRVILLHPLVAELAPSSLVAVRRSLSAACITMGPGPLPVGTRSMSSLTDLAQWVLHDNKSVSKIEDINMVHKLLEEEADVLLYEPTAG